MKHTENIIVPKVNNQMSFKAISGIKAFIKFLGLKQLKCDNFELNSVFDKLASLHLTCSELSTLLWFLMCFSIAYLRAN